MSKLNFIYIGKTMEHLIPKGSFNALKLSNKDKRTLYPLWDEEQIKNTTVLCPCSLDDKEVFVYGLGWKKFGKTNKVSVPLFSGELEDWDNYLNEYGKECLFYSLTGYSLKSNDCCANNMISEFLSLLQCKGGIKEYQKYVENVETIQEIQTKVFNEKLSFMGNYEKKSFIEKNLIRPCYRILFFISTPYFDTPADDDKMETFYRTFRHNEIKTSHKDYERMLELTKLMSEEIENGNSYTSPKYLEYKDEYHKIYSAINECVLDTLADEINEDNGVFPVCMKDRMTMLFGEQCTNLYTHIFEQYE